MVFYFLVQFYVGLKPISCRVTKTQVSCKICVLCKMFRLICNQNLLLSLRVVYGLFEGDYDYKGVKGYAYSASFGDSENNPGDRCFCPADDRCRKRGVLDALKCQGEK